MSTVVRTNDGRIAPGHSGNKAGRPKGFAGLAAAIRQQTKDGAELVEWALLVWRDPNVPLNVRWDAFVWLTDRGFGKPLTMIDLNASLAQPKSALDLAVLAQDDLDAIEERFKRAAERNRIEAEQGPMLIGAIDVPVK